MDKINFLAKDNFPVSTYTYDLMQQMINLVANLTALGGQTYILSGCVSDGNTVSDGIVVINGEILPFKGGDKKMKVAIQNVNETDHFAGVDYPEAYTHRTAVLSDNGDYNFADFVQIISIIDLHNKVKNISGDIVGTVKEWAGITAKIPNNYMLCDGRDLLVSDYPELFSAIGFSFGGNNDTVFKLPNCKGRVSVGYDSEKEDYQHIGNTGGFENVELTIHHLPNHQHIVPWGENLNTAWRPDWGYPDGYFNNSREYKAETDTDNTWPFTSPVGENKAHENRQPYIVFAKIIKVK